MAEAHTSTTTYAAMTVKDVLYEIFNFVYNSGSGRPGVRFADNDVTHSVYSGSAFAANAAAVSSSSFFNASGGYIVLESVNTMPSGYRWQIQIKATATSTIVYNFAPKGSWTYGSQIFSTTYPSTGNITVYTSYPTGTTSLLYFSASDLDKYSVNNYSVEYFRFLQRTNAGAFQTALRVGGYIPQDHINDTNPACVLSGFPSSGGTIGYWGNGSLNSNNYCRVIPDNSGTIIDLSTNGYALPVQITEYNHFVTRASKWVNFPVFLRQLDGNYIVGHFGQYDMFQGHSSRTNGATDTTSSYMVVNNYVMRYKP